MLTSCLLALLRAYQCIFRPLLGNRCRFYPSCSDYAAEAIARHGAVAGTFLAACRVCRCHPFHPGGFDPVPDALGPLDPHHPPRSTPIDPR